MSKREDCPCGSRGLYGVCWNCAPFAPDKAPPGPNDPRPCPACGRPFKPAVTGAYVPAGATCACCGQ